MQEGVCGEINVSHVDGDGTGTQPWAGGNLSEYRVKINLMDTGAQRVAVNFSFCIIAPCLPPMDGVAVAAASGIGLKINMLAGMPCWAIGRV